ncbi:hypothetical protein H4S07_004026, partial [Coemansia furcata]
ACRIAKEKRKAECLEATRIAKEEHQEAHNMPVTEWLAKLNADFPNILPSRMYNVDEMLLEFVIEDDVAIVLNIVLACNSYGTQHLPPILILMDKDQSELAMVLSADPYVFITKSGCLRSPIFHSWIGMFHNHICFLAQSDSPGHVFLTMDGFSPHWSKINVNALKRLPNTGYRLFPPQTTPIVQPLDRGIIQDLKLRMAGHIDAYREKTGKCLTLAEVVEMIREVWHDEIPTDVFVKAFSRLNTHYVMCP